MQTLSENLCFGGRQLICAHESTATGTQMRLSVFLPPKDGPVPCLIYLSGLTCTEENATVKAGFQRMASQLGLMVVCPDTSPRGEGVANDDAYDLGQGAGFYVDATEIPWAPHFAMYSYIANELPALIRANHDVAAFGLTGHSMGGHGALTIGMRNPETFRSVSAFSPIVSPLNCPWGEKALTAYLGPDRARWAAHDSCQLMKSNGYPGEVLIDQGDADNFLQTQLKTHLFAAACEARGQKARIRMQPGYDHSYYFIATFIEDHLRHHAAALA